MWHFPFQNRSLKWEIRQIPCTSPRKKRWAFVSHCRFEKLCLNTQWKRICETSHHHLNPKDWKESGNHCPLNPQTFDKGVFVSLLLPERPPVLLVVSPKTGKSLGLESVVVFEGIGAVSEYKKCKTFCMVLSTGNPWGKGPWQRGEEQRGGTPGATGT